MRSKPRLLAFPRFRKRCTLILAPGKFSTPPQVVRTALLCPRHVWGRGDDGMGDGIEY